MAKALLTTLVLFLFCLPVACRQTGGAPDADLFRRGRQLIIEGDYVRARKSLENYLAQHPNGKFASRAIFFIAKAEVGLGNFAAARSAFQRVLAQHPATNEAHKARYKMAMLDLFEGRREAALRKFRKLAKYPDGTLAPEARAMVHYLEGRKPWSAR
ncbi:MAG: outer membrane protein assembly factor BamD [bacterium]|nr:outer membrane protein assembly factor BamD [bacterium]